MDPFCLHSYDKDPEYSHLQCLILGQHTKESLELIESQPDQTWFDVNSMGETPLHLAVRMKDHQVCSALVKKMTFDQQIAQIRHRYRHICYTAFDIAVKNNDVPIVQLLLNRFVVVNCFTNLTTYVESAINLACQEMNLEIVKLIFSQFDNEQIKVFVSNLQPSPFISLIRSTKQIHRRNNRICPSSQFFEILHYLQQKLTLTPTHQRFFETIFLSLLQRFYERQVIDYFWSHLPSDYPLNVSECLEGCINYRNLYFFRLLLDKYPQYGHSNPRLVSSFCHKKTTQSCEIFDTLRPFLTTDIINRSLTIQSLTLFVTHKHCFPFFAERSNLFASLPLQNYELSRNILHQFFHYHPNLKPELVCHFLKEHHELILERDDNGDTPLHLLLKKVSVVPDHILEFLKKLTPDQFRRLIQYTSNYNQKTCFHYAASRKNEEFFHFASHFFTPSDFIGVLNQRDRRRRTCYMYYKELKYIWPYKEELHRLNERNDLHYRQR